MKCYYVYILSNKYNTVFYVGVTNNLEIRVLQHKQGQGEGSVFTSKYLCNMLLYYEEFPDIRFAIDREKQLKRWKREWKLDLIRKENPELEDLAANWY